MRATIQPEAAFPLKAVGLSLGLFGLLRSPLVEAGFVLPLTRWKQGAAEFYAGAPTAPINVTAECSGTDVLALCLAAILAWPVSWWTRLAGALGGIALILTLNTFRIGTLGMAAASPALFETLHLQVWPAILVLATSGYVFLWMRRTEGATGRDQHTSHEERAVVSQFGRRLGFLAALFLVAFAFCGPWIARSETLLAAGAWTAGEAALLLTAFGVSASASGNILATTRGAFMVTPECLATALVPLYLAGVFAAPLTWARRLALLLAAPPFFALLAIMRLLLLALPPLLAASPLFLVHGFHQFVLAAMVVAFFAWQHEPAGREGQRRAAARAAVAMIAALLFVILAGGLVTRAVMATAQAMTPQSAHALTELAAPEDAQGALATMVAFQMGFLLALGLATAARGTRLLAAFAMLFVTQVLFMVILGELAVPGGGMPHALLLRGWAVGIPITLALTMLRLRPAPDLPRALQVAHGSA